MNQNQKKIKKHMEQKIQELHECMDNLVLCGDAPNERGKLYNSMLKGNVEFEISHMEQLTDDLVQAFEE